jgi:hypothetical protein
MTPLRAITWLLRLVPMPFGASQMWVLGTSIPAAEPLGKPQRQVLTGIARRVGRGRGGRWPGKGATFTQPGGKKDQSRGARVPIVIDACRQRTPTNRGARKQKKAPGIIRAPSKLETIRVMVRSGHYNLENLTNSGNCERRDQAFTRFRRLTATPQPIPAKPRAIKRAVLARSGDAAATAVDPKAKDDPDWVSVIVQVPTVGA